MAGVKGRSGGKRAGAGRKAAPFVKIDTEGRDALDLLLKIAFGEVEANSLQVRAAVAAVQYTHHKLGEGGKKEARQKDAERVAGNFAPIAAPRLVASGGKPV